MWSIDLQFNNNNDNDDDDGARKKNIYKEEKKQKMGIRDGPAAIRYDLTCHGALGANTVTEQTCFFFPKIISFGAPKVAECTLCTAVVVVVVALCVVNIDL